MSVKLDEKFDKLVSKLSDSKYLDLLLKSVTEQEIKGVQMPGFPEENIQKQFVGSSYEHALREGYHFYLHVKGYAKALGIELNRNSKVLDFGCGWGRIIRFFFKDINSENLFGVDVDPDMIHICNNLLGKGSYQVINPEPPITSIEDNSLNVIFAYSVFSHLSEDAANSWIMEFKRILRPGGIIVATTQGKQFFDFCRQLKGNPEMIQSAWHQAIANSFPDLEGTISDYENGKFIYSGTGGGGVRDKSFYGEALIPEAYVRNVFGKHLHVREFFDDRNRCPQALFVLQK